MKTKYFKRFAITDNLVSIEELRSISQMQAQMDELVRYLPIQYLHWQSWFLYGRSK